ncbi:X-linked retinitis pigmentosa GTPase regulator-like isoform X1 [Haliotis rufescens]|uniref:X-linked retinitis pigmentosa GTPase regulator-like isoform X1 n=2 Tax=Haliotis rufescens TaxID=6454 RepID=UPI00201F62E0|nr:X-linked retinitis pigmentosa GTPase regulator-like isoform X1 [Haliotis rufescens]
MASIDDSDIPETGAVFTFGKSYFADNLPNKFWVKNDKVLQIECGDEHTALITSSGRIFMFGTNNWGQLGLPDVKTANKPSCIKSLKTEKLKLVACGRNHSIIATESGKLFTFGANGEGQLGIEDINDANIPRHIDSLDAVPYSMLGAGVEHSVALTEDGRVFVWGGGGEGQLGLGHDTEVPTPRELPFEENVVCIACGYYHTALVTENGYLYTFGETENGKLGLGDSPAEYATPQHVSSITEKVKWVACGGSHTAVLTERGSVYTFGEGANGQLGHGTMVLQTAIPHLLKLDFKAAHIACGENITAVVSEGGQIYTCGDGRHGKLGLGQESFSNQFKPSRIDRFTKFKVQMVSCGGCHMIVTARKRIENKDVDIEEEIEEASRTLNQTLNGLDLNNSASARDRRRQTMPSPMMSLNRTLPSLGNNRTLPVLNGHATLPNLKNQENLLQKSMLPGIKIDDKKETESEEESEEDEEEVGKEKKRITPQPLPRGSPRTKAPQPKDSEDEGVAGSEDEQEQGMEEALRRKEKEEEEDRWSEEEEEKVEEIQNGVEEEGDDELSDEKENEDPQPRSLPGPTPTPRKKVEEEDEEEEEEEDEEEEEEKKGKKGKKDKKDKKKEKDKKKKKGVGLFGKKKTADEEDDEEEEKDEEAEEEDVKGKKKKDKKEKEKKDKKKDKKKGKKGKEDEDEEAEEEEKTDKKDKKKDKKDKKKDKDKKKKGKQEEDEEEDGEEDKAEDGEKEKKKQEEKKEEAPPPKKKSRFCTIL